MELTGGEIYFIRERDLLSNELTEYFKVGIVREDGKDERSSLDRLKNHQTGNPRELILDEVFTTPLVERLESMIHAINATSGIRGEWLRNDSNRISEIKMQLTLLVEEAKAVAPVIAKADELKRQFSNDSKIEASESAHSWFAKYCDAHLSEAHYKPLVERINNLLIEAIEKGEDIAKVAKIQEKKIKFDLDEEALKAAHPETYELFMETVVTGPVGKFATKKIVLDQKLVDEELNPATLEILQVIEKVENGQLGKLELHRPRLDLWGLQSKAAWDKEVAAAHLKVICDVNAGIDGLCTWNRVEKKTEKFNKQNFKIAHPDLFEEFQVEIKGKGALIVDKKIGYAQ
jgi:hypothetical protein